MELLTTPSNSSTPVEIRTAKGHVAAVAGVDGRLAARIDHGGWLVGDPPIPVPRTHPITIAFWFLNPLPRNRNRAGNNYCAMVKCAAV